MATNKEALVTGSEGFVGGHLWKELEGNGYEVYGTTLFAPESGLPKNVFECNILEKESLHHLVEDLKPEVVFHLAAQAKIGLSFTHPETTFEINTIGTLNLLEVIKSIKDYHPRILIVGTAEEYGPVDPSKLPVTETSELNPQNPYAISKVANWFLARQYAKSFGFDIIYVTPFNHTGPGQGPGFLAPDVANQIVQIERGEREPVVFTGDLSSKRDFTDVRDVVRAYRLLTETADKGERFIISSGHSVVVKHVVDTLLGLAKVKIEHKIDPTKNRPSEITDQYGSHAKLSQVTGWEPQIPLEKTLSDLLDWYRTR